ncbi:MAG TPA: serine/threonine-protein kinase [Thermoanaerobaculia bacterium]|nr:serine/threonine-protein kinase [Thermoanaerobaculia bacterium]
MADQQPRTLGKYEILSVLGRGGMGIVYKARDPFIGRIVAVKTISAVHDLPDDELQERLRMEAQSAGRLQHPNIATLYDFGTADGISYIVLEYVEGTDLANVIDDKIPLSLRRKLEILIQIAHGLAYAHELDVVHRDMKPSNIRLSTKGTPKIIDFGLARFDSTRLTKTGFMSGTIAYMSPERIHGHSGPSDDIFALGTIGYELLTYRRAFTGSTPPEVMMKIISQPLPPPSSVEDVPPALDAIIMKGTARDAAERYATATEYAQALEEFLAGAGWSASRTTITTIPTASSPAPPTDVATVRSLSSETPTRIEPAPDPSDPTLIMRDSDGPARRRWGRWPLAAAALVGAIALGTLFAIDRSRGGGALKSEMFPDTAGRTSSMAATGSAEVTVPAGGNDPELERQLAETVDLHRGVLASLRSDFSSLELNSSERRRLEEVDSTAQTAAAKRAERDFAESARLLTTAIGSLRDLREDYDDRVRNRTKTAEQRRPSPKVPARVERAADDVPSRTIPEPQPPAPSPRTLPPPPLPVPQPVQPAVEDVERFISRVARAYETQDVGFFRRHDANFSERTGEALRSSQSVSVAMKIESIEKAGTERLRVTLARTDTFGGSQIPPATRRLVYTLERAGESWRILSITQP